MNFWGKACCKGFLQSGSPAGPAFMTVCNESLEVMDLIVAICSAIASHARETHCLYYPALADSSFRTRTNTALNISGVSRPVFVL